MNAGSRGVSTREGLPITVHTNEPRTTFSRFAFLVVCLAAQMVWAEDVRVTPRIIDGTLVPQSQFPTVGSITTIAKSEFCTGTLIAPRFVLTAAHCVNNQTPGSIGFNQKDGLFILGSKTYHTKHVFVHPSYAGDNSQQAEGAIDLSIYELDTDVKNITPSLLYRNTPSVDTILTLAGYGFLGTGLAGSSNNVPPKGKIATGKTPIDVVTNTFIEWNFDNVPAPNQESNTAPGDSGGPQFITENGVMFVASVTSGGIKGNASFGDFSYNTRVDIAIPWIESITGGPPVAGNHPPAITAFEASAIGFTAGTPITFTAIASDMDNDVLQYHWLFGDGTEDLNGTPTETHTYLSDGAFVAQLVVNDKKGGSDARFVSLGTVTSEPNPTPLTTATIGKKSFLVDLSDHEVGGSLEISLQSPAFVFASQQALADFFKATVITRIYIGNDVVDTIFGIDRKTPASLFKFDYKKGTVHYKGAKGLDILYLLNFYGLQNTDASSTLTIPIRVEFDTDIVHNGPKYLFGGDATFAYTAKKNVSAKGK